MKTFSTEKHNIPEGATHTCDGVFVKMNDESKDSGWCKVWFEGKWHRNGYLSNCVKIEDQTNIETPEEKEALDTMEGISREHLLKMIKLQTKTIKELNSSESPNSSNEIIKPLWAKWSIGDSVTKTKGSSWTGKVVGYYQTDLTSKGYAVESETEKGSVQIYPEAALCSAEAEAERVERERLESGQSLYELVQSLWCTVDSKYTPHPYSSPMVDDKTKEMYARLARAVDYRKEGE